MKILYKYRRISLNTIFDLMKNSIFFNDPNEFNDLFDAKLNVKFEGTEQQLRSFLTDPKRASDIFLNNGLRYLDGGLSYKEVFNYLEGIYDFIAKHVFRINCLTEKWNDQLMWSHYADNTGVCIGYQCEENGTSFSILTNDPNKKITFSKVDYTDDLSRTVNPLSDEVSLRKELLKKAKLWDKENEFRAIEMDLENPNVILNADALNEITFGIKCDENAIDIIKGITKQANIRYFKITLGEKCFERKEI